MEDIKVSIKIFNAISWMLLDKSILKSYINLGDFISYRLHLIFYWEDISMSIFEVYNIRLIDCKNVYFYICMLWYFYWFYFKFHQSWFSKVRISLMHIHMYVHMHAFNIKLLYNTNTDIILKKMCSKIFNKVS